MAESVGPVGPWAAPTNMGTTPRITGIRTAPANFGAAPDAPPASAGEAARLKWAAQQLEAVFINELWKSMRRTVMKSGMFDGPGVRMFEEMLDEERSKAMADGGDLGLAALLYEQLSVHLADAPAFDEVDSSIGRTTSRDKENGRSMENSET